MTASWWEDVCPGHRQWGENCDADGNVLAVFCRRRANSNDAQPVPPDDAYLSVARF